MEDGFRNQKKKAEKIGLVPVEFEPEQRTRRRKTF